MPERAVLVLISAVLVIGGLATVGYVAASGQGLSLDTIFLVLASLTLVLVFALYAKSEIDRLKTKASGKAAAKPAKAASAEE